MPNDWGSDGPISLPEPNSDEVPIIHELAGTGFGMTKFGLAIIFNQAQKDDMVSNLIPPDNHG